MTSETSSPLSVQLLHTLRGHTSDVNTVVFSPTSSPSSLLASCSSDKTIRLWHLNDANAISEDKLPPALARHTYQVHCVAFSPIVDDHGEGAAKYLASASTDGTCLLWDLTTKSVLTEFKHDSGSPIRVCQFSSDGVLLATAGDDELINLWDVTASSSRPVKTFSGHSASIVALGFFSNLLISGSFYGDLKLWSVNSSFNGPIHFEREAHDLGVTCLNILPSSDKKHHHPRVIASGGNDNFVKLWHCSSSKHHLKHVRTLQKHTCAVMCVAFGVEPLLANGSGDKSIVIWNHESGEFLLQFDAHARYVTCCSFSLDGHLLVSGSNDRTVKVWKVEHSEKVDHEKSQKSKKQHPTLPIDQWTVEIVQQWLEHFGIYSKTTVLSGNDLLAKSDREILDLFDQNEQLLNELSAMRHRHFVKQFASKKANKTTSNIPEEFLCPITHELMHDPVCASDGYTYERQAIEEWLLKKKTSPMMNSSINGTPLYSNKVLKMLIDKHVQQSH